MEGNYYLFSELTELFFTLGFMANELQNKMAYIQIQILNKQIG